MLNSTLKAEQAALEDIIKVALDCLQAAPEGTLNITTSRGRLQYLHNDEKTGKRTYLTKANKPLVEKLAQKDYAQKVLKVATAEQKRIARLNKAHDVHRDAASSSQQSASGRKNMALVHTTNGWRPLSNQPTSSLACVKQVYESLSDTRKGLVIPYVQSDKEFIDLWMEELNIESTMPQPQYNFGTSGGEQARSKSEVIIADRLRAAGVPYRYEPSVSLSDRYNIRPDFIVLNKRTRQELLWEHFGGMSDHEYLNNTMLKLSRYAAAGILPGQGLITTYETKDYPLDTNIVDAYIQQLLT